MRLRTKTHPLRGIAGSQNHRSLNDILQLPDITGPTVGLKELKRLHASVLHGISLRFGHGCPQAQFRHKLSPTYITRANQRYQLRSKLYQTAVDLIGARNPAQVAAPESGSDT
jgi:hypothetical protein